MMTSLVKKKINNDQLIERTVATYRLESRISYEGKRGSTSGTNWLEGQVDLALKRCGKERSGGSLSGNELMGI